MKTDAVVACRILIQGAEPLQAEAVITPASAINGFNAGAHALDGSMVALAAVTYPTMWVILSVAAPDGALSSHPRNTPTFAGDRVLL